MNPDSALIERLKGLVVERFSEVVGPAATYQLVDFPNHANSGDSAIWAGERTALSILGCRSSYLADMATFRPEAVVGHSTDGPLLLHGGGNLGGLWPAHADHREAVVRAARDRHVVQLPQTVSHAAREHLERLNRLAGDCARFDVLVRDQQSLDLAGAYENLQVGLCPDAAFALGELEPVGDVEADVVWIARADHERAFDVPAQLPDGLQLIVTDWLTTPRDPLLRRVRASAGVRSRRWIFGRIGSRAPAGLASRMSAPFDRMASVRVRRALRMLSAGRVVVTDRLHGHILAMLLGRPHVLLDTTERKVANFRAAFTSESALAHSATTSEEAVELAHALVTGKS